MTRLEDVAVEISDPLEACRADIAAGGHSVAAIVGDESGCDWAYSIGLTRSYDHPELVVVGLEAPFAGAVIEVLSRRVAEGERLIPGSTVSVEGGLEFRLHLVDPLWCSRGDWFVLGREVMSIWGERWPTSIQLTWPDANGSYPDQGGVADWQFRQPVLFSV